MSTYHQSDAASHRSVSLSRKGSTVSRSASLIKKNTAPQELKPSDILLDRFNAWKTITKNLIAYFEGIADIESNTARELTKLGGVIQVPFKEGNQFLGEGGLQDIYYNIRDKTRVIADHHANLAKTVDGSIVQHLQKLRAEIKAHIKNIQNDTGKLATTVAREREYSTRTISDLARAITTLKNTPTSVHAREDPFVMNLTVALQLQKQVNEENALQKSIIIMQQNSAHFEEGIIRSIQSAWSTFDEWQSRMSAEVQETWRHMGALMSSLEPDSEWVAFSAKSDHLLDPETPLRNPQLIDYPGKDDPSVIPVHVGWLERKKRFTKTYKESYYVLTPAGYLHEFNSADPTQQGSPNLSLFLPNCTLGPPSSSRLSKSHKFHIEGHKQTHGVGKLSISREHSYTFRARSHEDMTEWWNDLRMLVSRYLVASETMDRSGPVAAAVRSAGYQSEEEEEEEDGSSVEEEDEEDEEDAIHHQHEHDYDQEHGVAAPSATHEHHEEAPAYSQPSPASGIQMGANGYPLEKKGGPSGVPSTGEPSSGPGVQLSLSKKEQKAPEQPVGEPGPAPPSEPSEPSARDPAPVDRDGAESFSTAADENEVGDRDDRDEVTSQPASEGGLLGRFREMFATTTPEAKKAPEPATAA